MEGAVLLDAMIAARESAFSRALADAETIQTTPRTPQDAVQLELFIAVLRTRMLPTAKERDEALNNYRASIDDPAKEAALARMMSHVFLDHRKGQAIIREVIAETDGAASPQAWAILSDILVRTNSNALTLLRQLDRQPVGPTLPWERLRPPSSRTNIIEAIGHLVTARDLATTEEDRLILRQRKRRLGALLPPAERPGTGESDAEAE